MQNVVEEILSGTKVSREGLQSLENSFAEHPYSSSIAILLAKAYSLNNDIRFEHHIRKTAMLANNRKNLHDFLFLEGNSNSLEDKIVDEKIGEEREEIEAKKEGVITPPSEVSKSIEPEEKKEKDPFLNQFITEALNAGAAIDLLVDSKQIDNAEAETQKEKIEKENNNETVEKPEETVSIQKPIAPSKQSFSHWMNYLADEQLAKKVEVRSKEGLKTIFPRDPEEKKKVISIIDNFIEKEDSLVPKRAEFFSPSKAAKASLEDNDSLVTETLASIYAAQGNINKAISTYNKLSLLHPEKSSYFAALIEKLKTEKKDNKS